MKKLSIVAALLSTLAMAPAYAEEAKDPPLPRAPFKVVAASPDMIIVEDTETGCQTVLLTNGGSMVVALAGNSIQTSWPRLNAKGQPYCRDTVDKK